MKSVDTFARGQTCSIGPEAEVVILIFITNAGQCFDQGYASSLQNLRITNTGPFENEWGTIGTGRYNDHLGSSHGALAVKRLLGRLEFWIWLELDTDSSLVLVDEDSNDLALHKYMEIRIPTALKFRMKESVSRVYQSTGF